MSGWGTGNTHNPGSFGTAFGASQMTLFWKMALLRCLVGGACTMNAKDA